MRAQSYADPPESLLNHREWLLRRPDGHEQRFAVLDAQWDGHALRVALQGLNDRSAAELWRGSEVLLERTELPPPGAGEYYLEDLLGCTVRNSEGQVLGELTHFLDAPSGVLLVVRGERERWLPGQPPCLRRVDLARREVEVDWPADF